MNTDDGVKRYLEVMDAAFKLSEQASIYKVFLDFIINMKKKLDKTMMEFVTRYDKTMNIAKKKGLTMSEAMMGLKLIHDAGILETDRKLVLTEIDFSQLDTVYEKAKAGLNKYLSSDKSEKKDDSGLEGATSAIKLEAAFTAAEEEALAARGYYKQPRGRGNFTGSHRGAGVLGNKETTKRPLNPTGADGERLLCRACGSYRHMLSDCPHSYEKMQNKVYNTEEESNEEVFFTTGYKAELIDTIPDKDADDIILYTGTKAKKIASLGSETLGCALLDSGCTTNVCGEAWWNSYYDSLGEQNKKRVKVMDGEKKRFRFGGGEVLPATKKVKFPGRLAGEKVFFTCYVVNSSIPMLWSKPSMVKAQVVMDLPEDKAKILRWVNLDLTTAGHYALYILPIDDQEEEESVMITLPEDDSQRKDTIVKLHTVWPPKTGNNDEVVKVCKM